MNTIGRREFVAGALATATVAAGFAEKDVQSAPIEPFEAPVGNGSVVHARMLRTEDLELTVTLRGVPKEVMAYILQKQGQLTHYSIIRNADPAGFEVQFTEEHRG